MRILKLDIIFCGLVYHYAIAEEESNQRQMQVFAPLPMPAVAFPRVLQDAIWQMLQYTHGRKVDLYKSKQDQYAEMLVGDSRDDAGCD